MVIKKNKIGLRKRGKEKNNIIYYLGNKINPLAEKGNINGDCLNLLYNFFFKFY